MLPSPAFSSIQYYLAHSEMNVHLALTCPEKLSPKAFRAICDRVVQDAPQLLWAEDLKAGRHSAHATTLPNEAMDYAHEANGQWQIGDFDDWLAAPLADTTQPAFRALCRCSDTPDAQGNRSWILFQTTHAILEGGDVYAIVRGRGNLHDTRPVKEFDPNPIARFAATALLPLMCAMHLAVAKFVKVPAKAFFFRHLAFNSAALAGVARAMGVSRRALLFGLVSHAFDQSAKKRYIAYSMLPKERARLYDDEYLNVRMDDFRMAGEPDITRHIQQMAKALDDRGPSPLFVQAWHRRLTALHQWLHPRVPWIYPEGYFGYAPYDLILSVLPPVRPGRYDPALAGAQAYAGSNTGSTPTCIFVPGEEVTTFNLWIPPASAEMPDILQSSAQKLGIV